MLQATLRGSPKERFIFKNSKSIQKLPFLAFIHFFVISIKTDLNLQKMVRKLV